MQKKPNYGENNMKVNHLHDDTHNPMMKPSYKMNQIYNLFVYPSNQSNQYVSVITICNLN